MANIKITNLIKFYIVLLLSSGPKHGYELIKELRERLEKPISTSQIYPFLQVLEKNKYVTFEKTERDRKVYCLTKKGKEFVKTMLGRFGNLIDIAIEPKLSVCAHCGCKVYEGSHKEKIKGKTFTFCCHHCARSFIENKC